MKMKQSPPDESYTVRCPRLGHQIPFSYCRSENSGLPCFKSLDCWHEHFLVEDWLRNELTPEEWQNAFERPNGGKLLSLVELIQEAKKRQKEEP